MDGYYHRSVSRGGNLVLLRFYWELFLRPVGEVVTSFTQVRVLYLNCSHTSGVCGVIYSHVFDGICMSGFHSMDVDNYFHVSSVSVIHVSFLFVRMRITIKPPNVRSMGNFICFVTVVSFSRVFDRTVICMTGVS